MLTVFTGLLVLLRGAGLAIPTTSVVVRAQAAMISVAAGMAVTAVAAMVPAIRATGVSPLTAITGGDIGIGRIQKHAP